MRIDNAYVNAVREWKTSVTSKEVKQFVGFANYHRNFINDYAKIVQPLHSVTGKKYFLWGPEQQLSFEALIYSF